MHQTSTVAGFSPARAMLASDQVAGHGASGIPACPVTLARWHWLSAALDEVDYGMLLVSEDAHVVHTNQVARTELDGCHPLQLLGRELRARLSRDVAPLRHALNNAARRGFRKLLTLGEDDHRIAISVVPIATGSAVEEIATLVMLGKREVCKQLSVEGFARSHGLTGAETRVLVALCDGARPSGAAASLGVAISTVRTQIGSIRTKTGAQNIGALLKQMAVLPPLMGSIWTDAEPIKAL